MVPAVLTGVVALTVIYWLVIRSWFFRWGTTAADLVRAMPGDVVSAQSSYTATLAITIDARPEHIWPWLVQMGYRRAGLYSYDWLDRAFGFLDGPSAASVLPEFQHLAVGDEIPIGRGRGFPVAAIVPRQALVLAGDSDGAAWVWQFGLYPVDGTLTRLVSRNTGRLPRTVRAWFLVRLLEPAAFIMTRRMLIGLKSRAEALCSQRMPEPRESAVPAATPEPASVSGPRASRRAR